HRWGTLGARLARSAGGWLAGGRSPRRPRGRREATRVSAPLHGRERHVGPAPAGAGHHGQAAAVGPGPRAGSANPAAGEPEWTLVVDARAHLTPAQMVERKLASLLKRAPLPLSNLAAAAPGRLAARRQGPRH